jgi:hypothetical protein
MRSARASTSTLPPRNEAVAIESKRVIDIDEFVLDPRKALWPAALRAAREDSPGQLGAVHTWHDATVGYDAPIQSLLKVERTCRQRRAQIDPALLTQSEWTPELAIIRSGAYRISSRLDRNGVLEMTTNVLVAFYSCVYRKPHPV